MVKNQEGVFIRVDGRRFTAADCIAEYRRGIGVFVQPVDAGKAIRGKINPCAIPAGLRVSVYRQFQADIGPGQRTEKILSRFQHHGLAPGGGEGQLGRCLFGLIHRPLVFLIVSLKIRLQTLILKILRDVGGGLGVAFAAAEAACEIRGGKGFHNILGGAAFTGADRAAASQKRTQKYSGGQSGQTAGSVHTDTSSIIRLDDFSIGEAAVCCQ